MPIYEHRCPRCEERFAELMPASADPSPCRRPGSLEVVRLLSSSRRSRSRAS
ncbi:MAG: FmdB family zinc ribbon protein [Gemmatimonadota bacterium]